MPTNVGIINQPEISTGFIFLLFLEMYSKDQIRVLQDQTTSFLAAEKIDPTEIDHLREVLQFHEYRYYVMDDPLLADAEYDNLYAKLVHLEKEHPELITATSPTQRVGSSLGASFHTVQHLVPMLSLENSYQSNDLWDWDRKARELTGLTEIEYCIEPKFDGAGISLLYENDMLVRGVTRGDGIAGEDITENIRQVRSIPLTAPFSTYGIKQIEIRGEIYLPKKSFAAYNERLQQQGLPTLANPRNAASGSLRQKDPRQVAKRNLAAFLYYISYFTTNDNSIPPALTRHSTSLEMLWQCGLRAPVKEMKVVHGMAEVISHISEFEALRQSLPYEIDGMVVKVNAHALQEQMGMTTHHPRWAIAYKFKAQQATTVIQSIDFQVGRTGAVTPVAKLAPVAIGGVTVSSISIHNEEYIREKDLRIHDRVLIERAGDVIPQIVKALPELRTGDEKEIIFPRKCPVCETPLYKEEEEAVWRCVNIDCPAQVVERIIHFGSKDAMDIKGFGEANIRKFFAEGLLTDIPGIYHLDYGKIAQMEGFGQKSLDNLQAAIEKSKTQPLYRLIYGLGIRFVGEATAKTLAKSVKNIFELTEKKEEDLLQLEDVGIKVSAMIVAFFQNKANQEMLRQLEEAGLSIQQAEEPINLGSRLQDKTFLFTGTLQELKRAEAEAMVEKLGGKILGSVSSKLNYLVVGENAGSKLEKAKKIYTIEILTETDFQRMISEI